jgi:hypothetical protein
MNKTEPDDYDDKNEKVEIKKAKGMPSDRKYSKKKSNFGIIISNKKQKKIEAQIAENEMQLKFLN